MSKKAGETKRRTGKNKKKETRKKYGHMTTKHIRVKKQEFDNRKQIKNNSSPKNLNKKTHNDNKLYSKIMKKTKHSHQRTTKQI